MNNKYSFWIGLLFAFFSLSANSWWWDNKAGDNGVSTKENTIDKSELSGDPLPMDEAFSFSVVANDNSSLLISWDIHPEYQLYRNKFYIDVSGADFGAINWPEGIKKDDLLLGEVVVHKGQLNVILPLVNIKSDAVKFMVRYQGCWDGGICYPPAEKTIDIILNK